MTSSGVFVGLQTLADTDGEKLWKKLYFRWVTLYLYRHNQTPNLSFTCVLVTVLFFSFPSLLCPIQHISLPPPSLSPPSFLHPFYLHPFSLPPCLLPFSLYRHLSISQTVALCIVSAGDALDRTRMLQRFIELASMLQSGKYGNLFSFMAVMQGIHVPQVSTVSHPWEEMVTKMHSFQEDRFT